MLSIINEYIQATLILDEISDIILLVLDISILIFLT